jgi:hypothetical protein
MLTRRISIEDQLNDAAAVSAFRWSTGDGCSHDLGDPHFRNRESARRAWERGIRRLVWAVTFRFTVPETATLFDGLTTEGRAFVFRCWNHVGAFDLRGALAALAEDRLHLEAFEATSGARQIDDYLALFRADLDRVEQTARTFADWPADTWRDYPGHLSIATTYGVKP